MTPVPHPPYSPYFMPPHTKKVLRGKSLADVEEMKEKTAGAQKSIKLDEFKNCFEQWKKSLDKCIASNGEYFEGD